MWRITFTWDQHIVTGAKVLGNKSSYIETITRDALTCPGRKPCRCAHTHTFAYLNSENIRTHDMHSQAEILKSTCTRTGSFIFYVSEDFFRKSNIYMI